MITENNEYIECINTLKAINYLMDSTATAMTGDDVKYTKEALAFLSNSMNKSLQCLEELILNQSKRKLT